MKNLYKLLDSFDGRKSTMVFTQPEIALPNPIESDIDENDTAGARLSRIEQNQLAEIEKLKELNEKKDKEIEQLKISAQKERKRFWITYAITTGLTVIGIAVSIIIGIIF